MNRARQAVLTLLISLALAWPAAGVLAGEAQSQGRPLRLRAFAAALEGHLQNLRLLSDLPRPTQSLRMSADPMTPITALSNPELQALYLLQLGRAPQEGLAERSSGVLLTSSALDPSSAARLSLALRGKPAGPAGSRAAALLERWVEDLSASPDRQRTLAGRLDGRGSEELGEAWELLVSLFEGKAAPRLRAFPAGPGKGGAGRLEMKAAGNPAVDLGKPGGAALSLRATPHVEVPSISQMKVWLDHPARDSVSWIFRQLDLGAVQKILDQMEAPAPFREAALAAARSAGAAARLGPDFPAELAEAFLTMRTGLEGLLYERYSGLPALLDSYRRTGISALALRLLLDHAFSTEDGLFVGHDPRTWGALSGRQRRLLRRNLDREEPGLRGVKLRLVLSEKDDLAAVAHRFAMGRDPGPIARELAERLRRSPAGRLSIPLEEILPAFIRERLWRFEECSGPNCLNAALNVYREGSAQLRYTGQGELEEALDSDFRPVLKDEPLESGDLLVYLLDQGDTVEHAAVYVGDGYVFTKNGAGRYRPYLFQSKAALESAYFPDGGYRLFVFRGKHLAPPRDTR